MSDTHPSKSPATADVIEKMKQLNSRLREAAEAYYNEDREIMSNYEYDALYDGMVALEDEFGILIPDSITQRVGVDVADQPAGGEGTLPKVEHETPMLSLDKTKSRDKLREWLDDKVGCLSWKLDGSTVVVTYDDGHMVQAVTRGNGTVGEDITAQASRFRGIPKEISCLGRLVIRGEALMTYSEFTRINQGIDDVEARYKNPRNLASGTMRALDPSVLDEREIVFCPFTLVSMSEGAEDDMREAAFDPNSYSARLDWLAAPGMGFESVGHEIVTSESLIRAVDEMEAEVDGNDIPSDGLVLFFDDVSYGDSLGSTSHAPKNGIAFKWTDETAKTRLADIFWQTTRSGRINPVAVFEPVQLEGTTVERATLNNVTFIEDMLGTPFFGQEIEVYKANKIIPCIVSAERDMPEGADVLDIPKVCPACGSEAHLIQERDSTFLMCANDECPARNGDALSHFVSRDALDVRGLSKETLSKLMEAGIVSSFEDILDLPQKEAEIVGHIDGIGQKSFDNLVASIERARNVSAARFIYALGIREIGRSASADIASAFAGNVRAVVEAAKAGDVNSFTKIAGIGNIMADEIISYMSKNAEMVISLLSKVTIADAGEAATVEENGFVSGKTFVVTGDVHIFAKRDDLKGYITARGGKLTGSVSAKTDYLITNSPDSGTSKNQKARELGIPIITEEQFCDMAGVER